MRAQLRELVGDLAIPAPAEPRRACIVAISDTLAALAAVGLGRSLPPEERFRGVELPSSLIGEAARTLSSDGAAGRRAALPEEELPLILAGAAILDEIHRLWPARRFVIADRGLHDGIVLELADELDGHADAIGQEPPG